MGVETSKLEGYKARAHVPSPCVFISRAESDSSHRGNNRLALFQKRQTFEHIRRLNHRSRRRLDPEKPKFVKKNSVAKFKT